MEETEAAALETIEGDREPLAESPEAKKLAEMTEPFAMIGPDEANLTLRELEVARLIGCGLTASQIADKLGLGSKTIDTHRASVYKKTLARTTSDVTRWCLIWGYIRLDGTTT